VRRVTRPARMRSSRASSAAADLLANQTLPAGASEGGEPIEWKEPSRGVIDTRGVGVRELNARG
jgi:hypothetical protein